jgi:hypothetical protein
MTHARAIQNSSSYAFAQIGVRASRWSTPSSGARGVRVAIALERQRTE